MGIIAHDSDKVPRLLLTTHLGELIMEHINSTFKYVQVSDDTSGQLATIWDPAAGESLHLSSMFFYASGAGTVEVYDNASGTTIMMFEFTAKGTNFMSFGSDIVLAVNRNLGVKWTSGAGTRTLDVTAFGHEH